MAEDFREELWKEETWKGIEGRAESGDVVILAVSRRTSESFYNYKTSSLFIIYKDVVSSYEESFEREICVLEITAGVFQPFSMQEVEAKMRELKKKGFIVRRITL
ncbi:MAG: hypothetical protein LM590_13560 [Thermofilum sp.]|nr:hypothetical protein [Thermofilum sp.]